MNEEMTQQMMAAVERLASAAKTLDRVLSRLDAQQAELSAKVDRIVAAIEEDPADGEDQAELQSLTERVAELERANVELKAQAARMSRKTLSPLLRGLVGKFDGESGEKVDPAVLEKTLQALSVEQRIAVKAEMARAGILE
jgi:predicted RNase H-like nuclease (RuvC/YqgF family)